MHVLYSMRDEKAYEIWKRIQHSWQKVAEKVNDEGIDNYNKKYYNDNVKRGKENGIDGSKNK